MRMDTQLSSANLDLRAAGSVRSLASDDRSGTFDIAVGNSRETQPHIVWPGAPSGGVPLALKSAVKFDSIGMRLDNIQASVGGTDVTGRLGVGFGKPLVLDGEVKAASLDLPALLAAVSGIGAPNPKGNWSETPFAVSAWPSMIGAVSVNAARATIFPATRAANLRAGLQFTGNDVAVEQIDAELLGGRLSGETVMRRGGEGLGLSGRIALRDADAAQMLGPDNASARDRPRRTCTSVRRRGAVAAGADRLAQWRRQDHARQGPGRRARSEGLCRRDPQRRSGPAARCIAHTRRCDARAGGGPAGGPQCRSAAFDRSGCGSNRFVFGAQRCRRSDRQRLLQFADSGLDARFALRGPATVGAAQRPELAIQLRGSALSPQKSLDVSALTGWLALRSVDQQTRRIEAIEQGRPAETALQNPAAPAAPVAACCSCRTAAAGFRAVRRTWRPCCRASAPHHRRPCRKIPRRTRRSRHRDWSRCRRQSKFRHGRARCAGRRGAAKACRNPGQSIPEAARSIAAAAASAAATRRADQSGLLIVGFDFGVMCCGTMYAGTSVMYAGTFVSGGASGASTIPRNATSVAKT